MGLNDPQPDPVANELQAVWDLVIEDMRERDRIGAEKYGTRLQPFNGRVPLKDAYQEVLDLAVYLRQEIQESSALEAEGRNLLRKFVDARREAADWKRQCGDEVQKTDAIRGIVEPYTDERRHVVEMVRDAIRSLVDSKPEMSDNC